MERVTVLEVDRDYVSTMSAHKTLLRLIVEYNLSRLLRLAR
jgi:hypothetical protein